MQNRTPCLKWEEMSSFGGIVLMLQTGIYTKHQINNLVVSNLRRCAASKTRCVFTLPPPISSKSRRASSARSAEALSQRCFAVLLLRMLLKMRPAYKDTVAGCQA